MLSLINLDYRLFKAFNALAGQNSRLDALFVFLAEYILYFMLGGLALFILFGRKRSAKESVREKVREKAILEALFAAFIGRAVIVSLIRAFFFRQRPFLQAVVTQLAEHSPKEASFPSAHATIMFAMAFSLLFVSPRWGVLYLILATVSSLSRVVTGVHFPFDILGGLLVGALAAFLSRGTVTLLKGHKMI